MVDVPRTDSADPVDRVIAQLYRSVLAVPPPEFRAWALDRINTVVPHDAALWGTGFWEGRRFHNVTLRDVPEDYPLRLERTADENPLIRRMLAVPEVPTTMDSVYPDEQFFQSRLYHEAFEPVGIQRILGTVHVDPRSGLYSLVSLYRRDRNAHFTDAEKAIQRRLNYHLFNAVSHSFFIHLARTHRDRPAQAMAAVVDVRGQFHEAQPRFLDAMEQHFPDHRQRTLPFPLPGPGETRNVGSLCVRCEAMGDLYIVHIWPSGPLDKLTQREREIVIAVAHGLSFKQAARKIGVAPSTVANHLYRIYRKLGVASRTELADLIHAEVPAED
ncbi:LuxR family transcriptional regulator [Stagnimonas aquatica]|uniref:LuxR family transcriptional regulator n=1 Tax=Stagnimonas aquatica TaxID=2689987 RepID=A0A3N0VGW4_9GAMM|nr:helix-turn-helix transcriptional regulator [Stagnimonas aquatica]ROH91934.1 LuxR family transcriptional regulator [Stagnimonas aquatica]